MPTILTKTVKSSGGDYTTLSAAEAGEQGNFVSLDRQLDIECYSMTDTTAVTIDGSTTDATRYMRIFTPTTERHAGKWTTGKHILSHQEEFNGVHTIAVLDNYVRLEGLQIEVSNGQADPQCIEVQGVTGVRISACILRKEATRANAEGIRIDSGTHYIWNTVIYDLTVAAIQVQRWNGVAVYAYNVTVQNCVTGFESQDQAQSGTFTVKNCVAQDGTDGFLGTFHANSTNNCSDIASDAPGSNPSTGEVTFADEAGDNFHLAASDAFAKDLGTDLSGDANLAFTDDVDGVTRTGTWDIGADEYFQPALVAIVADKQRQTRIVW